MCELIKMVLFLFESWWSRVVPFQLGLVLEVGYFLLFFIPIAKYVRKLPLVIFCNKKNTPVFLMVLNI